MNIKTFSVSLLILGVPLFQSQAQQAQQVQASPSPSPAAVVSDDQLRLGVQDVLEHARRSKAGVVSEEQIIVNVLGEVNKPARLVLAKAGTLLDAIASAGGFTKGANPSKIVLIHKSTGDKPDSTAIDLKPVLQGRAKDIALRDGDTVIVGVAMF